MRKNIYPSFLLMLFALGACSPSTTNTSSTGQSDSLSVENLATDTTLIGKMSVPKVIEVGQPIQMTFTVYNTLDSGKSFLKWQTPFEPPLSKYLDIFLNGTEDVNYKGAMARRVMPPPAESYVTLQPKDSLSATVDLLKSYDLTKPGNYVIKYNSAEMTGINVKDSVSFQLK